jgi:D-alanyl-lipoteichoic acid acyltransferase DltB (MBOAT superfamily)
VIDIYRGKAKPQKSLLDCALYISLFPQLVAGPIVRYDAIAAQIAGRKESWDDFVAGFTRFVVGLAKKLLIADQVAPLADAAFAQNAEGMLGLPMAWLGALAYTLQIFFDFSGYSDMAIGLGRMFGFRFAENFNYPYISRSATEFWRRWHISLGSFFRDYVYFPLGGSRCSKKRLVLNLFVVWTLTGLWHGANWTFVFWGWLYFVLLTVEKISGFSSAPVGARLALPLRNLYALFFIVIGWVLFRAENLGLAVSYYQALFGGGVSGAFSAQVSWIPIALGILFSVPLMPKLRERIGKSLAWRVAEPVVMLCLFALCLIASTANEYQPFIYFNF